MNDKPIRFLLICTLFTGIGLVGGFMAASQKSASSHGHEEEQRVKEIKEHPEHPGSGGHEEFPVLSAQALKNLKVEVAEVKLTSHTTHRSIAARIEATPKTVQPILAPIGGIIQHIEVEHGELVKKGDVLLTLMRDSIPRPELKVTKSLLNPEQRLRGLSLDEIALVNQKSDGERQAYLWKNSLKRFGYWTPQAQRLWSSLSKNIQNLPFAVAVIGEISANGYLSESLVAWVEQDKNAAGKFFEIASFVLDGKSLSFIKNLSSQGAFESLVTVKVPAVAQDFDVHEIFVRPGNHVERGQVLGELHNLRELHVEAHPRGSEIPLLVNALKKDLKVSAVPLVRDSGEVLNHLKIRNLFDDAKHSGTVAHLEIPENPSIVKEEAGKKFRSWKIRAGSRYLIRVPQEKFDQVFVLPSGAVVDEGPDKIVFVQEGNVYKPAKVIVLYQNDEVAVLSQESEFFSRDPIVIRGAFDLSLALKAQTGGAVDPHAGCQHP